MHLSWILSTHFKARKISSVPELWVQNLLQQMINGRKLTISSSVMVAEHRVCDEKHKKKQRQSDGAEKHEGWKAAQNGAVFSRDGRGSSL